MGTGSGHGEGPPTCCCFYLMTRAVNSLGRTGLGPNFPGTAVASGMLSHSKGRKQYLFAQQPWGQVTPGWGTPSSGRA